MEKFRFTVDVSKALADEIERLAAESGRTKAEVFRTAIALLSHAKRAESQDMTVGAWRSGDDGKPVHQKEFVGF